MNFWHLYDNLLLLLLLSKEKVQQKQGESTFPLIMTSKIGDFFCSCLLLSTCTQSQICPPRPTEKERLINTLLAFTTFPIFHLDKPQ